MIDRIGSNQIMKMGIVVEDIHEAAAYYKRMFNLENDLVINHQHKKRDIFPDSFSKYHGEKIKVEMKWFVVDLGPVYIQVIEPERSMPSPWLAHLNEYGPGVCFMTFCIDDLKDHIEFMENNEMPMTFIEEKGYERYAYFETQKKIGVTIELKERKTI